MVSQISKALREAFSSPRELELAAGCSHPSASRYWNGHSIPNVVLLARLMRQSRGLATAFWEYCGLDQASLDAEGVELRRLLIEAYGEIEALHAECQRLLAEVEKPVAPLAAAPHPGTDQPAARGIQAEGRR